MKLITIIFAFLFTNTVYADNASDVKNYFDNNKIGNSPDYGVFKRGNDYIITIHGFDDDLSVCIEIINMLNKEQPNTYSCKPLNH